MSFLSSVTSLRTNLADYPVTMAMKDGRITSPLVKLDFCGPKTAHDGFKAMIRENDFEAGELAIVTYLQAKAFGKPFVLLPTPISGRFQHHCIGFNQELGHLNPKDIEGRKVGVRTYAQTTGLWVRGILQHEYGVDLNKVTWLTIDDRIWPSIRILRTVSVCPPAPNWADDARRGDRGGDSGHGYARRIRACKTLIPDADGRGQGMAQARGRDSHQSYVRGA